MNSRTLSLRFKNWGFKPNFVAEPEGFGAMSLTGAGLARKYGDVLMNAVYPFQKSPRCSATSKRTRRPCMAPAVTDWTVCRFHGARGGGPKGERNGMYRHGLNTKEAVKERRFLSDLLRQSRQCFARNLMAKRPTRSLVTP